MNILKMFAPFNSKVCLLFQEWPLVDAQKMGEKRRSPPHKSKANDWPHVTVHAGCPEQPYIAFLAAVGAI